ncbi:hypothetical protein SCHIN_v1c04960 [Spiroplasma chinense]|uniref:DUF2779 domain-containing protein n=1 Tax=Spiroplasma chinense TaxID=216932 RepID=A0A5B9Y4J8_9MOLU|nr:DUF2779 domain-containing protein [Spiroplasma chinense]QEH61693.1 hypothetical protein SCHIN_v1c04960 [Spiroplasma chinense]
MELVNNISKEDFKKYFAECNKLAWIFHSKENFLKAIELNKRAEYSFFTKVELDDEENFDTGKGFDPLSLYSALLEKENLTEDEEEQKKLILEKFEEFDGFEMTPVSAETIVDGNLVGDYARQYFIEKLYQTNHAEKKNYKYFDFQQFGYKEAISKTTEILQDENYKMLFEPSFVGFGSKLRTRCDILINKGNRRVEIIEVKGVTKPKKEHFYDLFYQYLVLTNAGYFVDDIKLCYLNPNYYRGLGEVEIEFDPEPRTINYETEIKVPFLDKEFKVESTGEPDDIELSSLFIVSNKVKEKAKPEENYLNMFLQVLNDYDMNSILYDISSTLGDESCLSKLSCGKYKFKYKDLTIIPESKYCHHVVQYFDKTELNLFNLPRSKPKAAKIWFQKSAVYMNDVDLDDQEKWVDDKGKPLFNEAAKKIIKTSQDYINKNRQFDVRTAIDSDRYPMLIEVLKDYYKYPIYMYDFETAKWAIPNFNRTKSYTQVPFQYSIHVILDDKYDFKRPEETMKHFNFIGEEIEDPRPKFIEKFIKDCFAYGPGYYVAYNKSFERMVLKDLIKFFPEYEAPLRYIYQNTIDLMDFFAKPQNNWLIYHPEFRGSASIKITQPTLDNSLTYKDLRINKGDKASQTFRQFIDKAIDKNIWDNLIKSDMLAYCDRDTLAMIVVLQKVVEYVEKFDKDYLTKINRKLKGD